MLGNNRIYAEFTLIFTLRAICPDQKLFAESSSSRQTGVINRDAVFCVVVRYPLFAAEISRLDAQKIILVAVWRHAKILVSADFIVFGCNAISRKNQARCEPKRRPSQTEPMRNSSSPVSFGYSAHTKPSELPQTAVSGHQARDLRHKTNAPAPRRGFSHRPRNDIRAALALVAVSHADAPADRDCRAKI